MTVQGPGSQLPHIQNNGMSNSKTETSPKHTDKLPEKGEVKQKLDTSVSKENLGKVLSSQKTPKKSFVSYQKEQMTNQAKTAFQKVIGGLARGLKKVAHHTFSSAKDQRKSLIDQRSVNLQYSQIEASLKPEDYDYDFGDDKGMDNTNKTEEKTPLAKSEVTPSHSGSITNQLESISKTDKGIADSLREIQGEISKTGNQEQQNYLDAIIENVSTICDAIETRKNNSEDFEDLLIDLAASTPDGSTLTELEEVIPESKLKELEESTVSPNKEVIIEEPSEEVTESLNEDVEDEELPAEVTEVLTEKIEDSEIEEDLSAEVIEFEESFGDDGIALGQEIAQKLGETKNPILSMRKQIDPIRTPEGHPQYQGREISRNDELATLLDYTLENSVSILEKPISLANIKNVLNTTSSVINKAILMNEQISKKKHDLDKQEDDDNYDKWAELGDKLEKILREFDENDSYTLDDLKKLNKEIDNLKKELDDINNGPKTVLPDLRKKTSH